MGVDPWKWNAWSLPNILRRDFPMVNRKLEYIITFGSVIWYENVEQASSILYIYIIYKLLRWIRDIGKQSFYF